MIFSCSWNNSMVRIYGQKKIYFLFLKDGKAEEL